MSAIGENEIYTSVPSSSVPLSETSEEPTNEMSDEPTYNFEEYDVKEACEKLIYVYPTCNGNENEIKNVIDNIEEKEKYELFFNNVFNIECSNKKKCRLIISYLYYKSTNKKLNTEFLDKIIKTNKKYSEDYLISYFNRLNQDDVINYFNKHKIKMDLKNILTDASMIQIDSFKIINIICNKENRNIIKDIIQGHYPSDWVKFLHPLP